MKRAIRAYLSRVHVPKDHAAGVLEAAEALKAEPWRVVSEAGRLVRCVPKIAETDLALSHSLHPMEVNLPGSIVKIAKGQVYPVQRRVRPLEIVAPLELARGVVQSALLAASGEVRTGLDPACGAGAFLLAMKQMGVTRVCGADSDRLALEVAAIAVPGAILFHEDPIHYGAEVDLVVGAPLFHCDRLRSVEMKRLIRRRFPWLLGRFDLIAPFAAAATARVRKGGGLGLVVPSSLLVKPYAAELRRKWLREHQIVELLGPRPFSESSLSISVLILKAHGTPAPLPVTRVPPKTILKLPNAPISTSIELGDIEIVEQIRQNSVLLRDVCRIQRGFTLRKNKLDTLKEHSEEGLVAYADADQFFEGKRSYADPKHFTSPPCSECPGKVVVQRQRQSGVIRAAIDTTGVVIGSSCNLLATTNKEISLQQLLHLICSPLTDAVLKLEFGETRDIFESDLGQVPVPKCWLLGQEESLSECWELTQKMTSRLLAVARFGRHIG